MSSDDHEDDDHRHHRHSLSRLSVCRNSIVFDIDEDDGHDDDDDDDVDYGMARYMSGLSIESLEVDVELSESEKESNGRAIIAPVKEGGSDKEKSKGGVLTRQETWRRKCRRMRSKNEDDDDVVDVGRRSMDFDEMKGCRDLGFDLELDNNTPSPSRRHSVSFETSSGATSPISNWRISSPGDDPRDVKARLKMWAHAVAAASTSN